MTWRKDYGVVNKGDFTVGGFYASSPLYFHACPWRWAIHTVGSGILFVQAAVAVVVAGGNILVQAQTAHHRPSAFLGVDSLSGNRAVFADKLDLGVVRLRPMKPGYDMKRLSKELYIELVAAIVSGVAGTGLTYWLSGSWELAIVVGVILFGGGLRSLSSSYFAFRGAPEYQKDTKDA